MGTVTGIATRKDTRQADESKPEWLVSFFPMRTRFVREGRIVTGWLEGYHEEQTQGRYGKTKLFAIVVEKLGGHSHYIPIAQLIDD